MSDFKQNLHDTDVEMSQLNAEAEPFVPVAHAPSQPAVNNTPIQPVVNRPRDIEMQTNQLEQKQIEVQANNIINLVFDQCEGYKAFFALKDRGLQFLKQAKMAASCTSTKTAIIICKMLHFMTLCYDEIEYLGEYGDIIQPLLEYYVNGLVKFFYRNVLCINDMNKLKLFLKKILNEYEHFFNYKKKHWVKDEHNSLKYWYIDGNVNEWFEDDKSFLDYMIKIQKNVEGDKMRNFQNILQQLFIMVVKQDYKFMVNKEKFTKYVYDESLKVLYLKSVFSVNALIALDENSLIELLMIFNESVPIEHFKPDILCWYMSRFIFFLQDMQIDITNREDLLYFVKEKYTLVYENAKFSDYCLTLSDHPLYGCDIENMKQYDEETVFLHCIRNEIYQECKQLNQWTHRLVNNYVKFISTPQDYVVCFWDKNIVIDFIPRQNFRQELDKKPIVKKLMNRYHIGEKGEQWSKDWIYDHSFTCVLSNINDDNIDIICGILMCTVNFLSDGQFELQYKHEQYRMYHIDGYNGESDITGAYFTMRYLWLTNNCYNDIDLVISPLVQKFVHDFTLFDENCQVCFNVKGNLYNGNFCFKLYEGVEVQIGLKFYYGGQGFRRTSCILDFEHFVDKIKFWLDTDIFRKFCGINPNSFIYVIKGKCDNFSKAFNPVNIYVSCAGIIWL